MPESLGGKLYITSPDEPERVVPIERTVIRLGRAPAPENDLVLEHGWVSRTHVRIFCDRLPYHIQDMHSSNGTSVNDLPLPPGEIRPLKNDDIIAIGPFRLRFEAPTEPPESVSPPIEERGKLGGLGTRAAPTAQPPAPPGVPPPETKVGPLPPERWVGMPDHTSRWLYYLPPIYSEHDFVGRLLLIFEDLLGPVQQSIAHFDLFLDPTTAPETFFPWLNHWLAEITDEHWSSDRQRELLKNAAWLYRARGTVAGLRRYLEICTGFEPEIIENANGPHTFKVVLHTEGAPLDRRMVERIIEINRPAHTSYILELD